MADDDSTGSFGRPAYTLTDAERTYLRTGDTGSYRKSVLEEQIEEKTNRLGPRINHLLSDVQLLASGGYLDKDTWGEHWLDFLGRDPPEPIPSKSKREGTVNTDTSGVSDAALQEAYSYGSVDGLWRETSAATEIGRELGRLVHQLTIYPWDRSNGLRPQRMDAIHADFIWGFIHMLTIDVRLAGNAMEDARRERMETLMSELYERHETEYERDRDLKNEFEAMHQRETKWTSLENEMQERIREILSEEGVLMRQDPGHDIIEDGAPEWRDNPKAIRAGRVFALLIQDLIDTDFPTESWGARNEFRKKYGPVEDLDVDDVVTRDRVLDVVESNRLLLAGELKTIYADDGEFLKELAVRGVDPVAVIEQVQKQHVPSSAEIADALDTHTAVVTEICNKLAGETEFMTNGWFGARAVTGDKSGWEFTAYGHLLAGHLLGQRETDKQYPDLLEEAASQVGIEDHAFTR